MQSFVESHSINTPEQVDLHFNVAGVGSRFVAVLLDHLIVSVVYIFEVFLLIWIASANKGFGAGDGFSTAEKWALAIWLFMNFVLYWGYFSLFEAYWKGKTPGKHVMKLRVLKDSGRQITLFESLARNLLRVVDYLPAGYLAGLITMWCNKAHKRIGDFVAGTIVVHERRDDAPMLVQSSGMFATPTMAEPWRDANVPEMFPSDAIARLTQQDLVVIETFFARALDMSLELRAGMAQRIAAQMAAKMGVVLPEGNPERALESIAYAMRGLGRTKW